MAVSCNSQSIRTAMVWIFMKDVGRGIVHTGAVIVTATYAVVCTIRPPFGPDEKVVAS